MAVLAAILAGLEELGVPTLKGVGAPLKGVFGSEGAGELLFIDWPRVISTPPLASDLGDTKYIFLDVIFNVLHLIHEHFIRAILMLI